MTLNIRPVDPARLREVEGHTLSPETRRALLASSLSTRPDRRDRLPFAIMGTLLVVGCAWIAWEFVR